MIEPGPARGGSADEIRPDSSWWDRLAARKSSQEPFSNRPTACIEPFCDRPANNTVMRAQADLPQSLIGRSGLSRLFPPSLAPVPGRRYERPPPGVTAGHPAPQPREKAPRRLTSGAGPFFAGFRGKRSANPRLLDNLQHQPLFEPKPPEAVASGGFFGASWSRVLGSGTLRLGPWVRDFGVAALRLRP